jgi:sugar O-acyltransferase (sialic acid O-acetyltransferase NeuD family)
MRELLLWGATGQAKVLHELIRGMDIRLVALVDNRSVSSPIQDIPVLEGEEGLNVWLVERGGSDNLYCAVAVGGGRGKDRIVLMDLLQARGLKLLTLIHRTAFVAHNATIGEGCQVLSQSAVCAHARLGRGVIINTAASLDHDGVIGEGVHLGPGARLAGEVTVGDRAFIGIGAVILPRITVGEDAVVGAGAVVTEDVAPGMTVAGNPARPMT